MKRHPLYPDVYLWFVLLSSLDVFCTWIVLGLGGGEANPVAAKVMGLHPKALVFYKFVIVAFVICLCEIIGDRRPHAGRWLALSGCAITCAPVLLAIAQLLGWL